MHEVKASLQQLVVSDAWGEWNQKSSHEMEGKEVHNILTSVAFWKGVKELLVISESIVYLLHQCDKGVPVVGKVYYAMFLIGEELGALKEGTSEQHPGVKLSAVKYEQISWLCHKRWEYLHSDMHSTGFVLEPKFQSAEYGQDQNAKVMQGFLNILEKLVPDANDQAKALQQLAQFRNQEGLFGRPGIQAAMKAMPGWKFWQQWGRQVPELQTVGVTILSQCSTASTCKHNWSIYDFIHSKKRNKLTLQRAQDLVHVFSDLRLTHKVNSIEFEEEMVSWMEEEEPNDN
jgi:hypothetical protein